MNKLISVFLNRAFFWVNTTQFLDTFNNNFFRTALTSFIMFETISLSKDSKALIAAIAVGLLMLPAFLFSALAGEIADKYPKDYFIKILRFLQSIAIIFACLGFALQNIPILLLTLFLMGTFGSMLSPAKYSILPEILKEEDLLAANGFMQAAVYISILGGTILGGIIFSLGKSWLFLILIAAATAATISSLFIPRQKAASPQISIDINFLRSAFLNMRFARSSREIFLCILAISWFWFLGTILLSQMPAFAAHTLNGNDAVFTLFIVLFSGGVGIGSILCQMLLGGKISNKYAIISLFIATLFLADLAYVASTVPAAAATTGLREFLFSFTGMRIAFDLLAFSLCGGVYVVPLTAMLQVLSGVGDRSRIIAANNIINALFMVAGSGMCAAMLALQKSVPFIFGFSAALNTVAIIALYLMFKKKGNRA